MTAQWDDDIHHALHSALTGERQGYYVDFGSLATLAQAMTRVFIHDGGWSTFRDSAWGDPVDPRAHRGQRFLAYLQNHDQVGNRARGDRLSPALPAGLLAAGAALVLCGPFTPMLFMGEEWGASTPWQFFTDFDEPDLAGRSAWGGARSSPSTAGTPSDVPDPQARATRDASVLDWSELGAGRSRSPARLVPVARSRCAAPLPSCSADDLTRGARRRTTSRRGGSCSTRGQHGVVVNLSETVQEVPVDLEEVDVVLAWEAAEPGHGVVRLAGHSAAIVRG